MAVNVYTVHHTGTHFLLGMLRRAGLEHFHRHFEQGFNSHGLILSTIRDPWMCYITHQSRGTPHFWKEWRLFNQLYKIAPDLHILPIDTENREEYRKAMSDRLGVDLRTSWKPAGSQARCEVEPVDLSEIYELEVVKEFYPKGPTYQMDYLETMTTQDPIVKRIQMGVDHKTIKEVFNLSDKEFDDKLREVEGPKKRGPKPKQKRNKSKT